MADTMYWMILKLFLESVLIKYQTFRTARRIKVLHAKIIWEMLQMYYILVEHIYDEQTKD